MKKLSCTLLFIAAMFFSNLAFCQNAASEKQAHIKYIAQELSISEVKAEQVVSVLTLYKTKAKSVIADNALSEAGRKAKLDLLIDEKNSSLTRLLTAQQLLKIIPTTERRNVKPAGNSNK